jgi:GNAT superfamily N-acetyltransferase
VAEKRTSHCAVVPASDRSIIDAWFSLSFGLQHVHALRELAPNDFRPATPRGLTIRLKEIGDVHALAELGLVLPRHVNESPVFSRLTVPTLEESLAEAEADLDNQEYTEFVAEHDGGVVGTATGCSVELSSGNTRMMRPASVFLLAHVAVLPDARGLGAGRALAEAVMVWSRDEGTSGLPPTGARPTSRRTDPGARWASAPPSCDCTAPSSDPPTNATRSSRQQSRTSRS